MDTLYRKLLLGFAVVLLTNVVAAQEKVSKKISETYAMSNAGEMHLNNKYGDITINGWSKNSVSIQVDITVTHKKRDNAKSLLDRIGTNIKAMGDYITVDSEISEKSDGFFAKYFNKANPFDFDRSNVQINYTIYLPLNSELNITNKFGDVVIEDWTGKLKLEVQHGDIWINKNLNNADVDLRYGKLKAKDINYGNIRLKNGSVALSKSKDLRLTSSGSYISMDEVSALEIYSSKDEIDIERVSTVTGSLEFTNMQLENLEDEIDLVMKIADFKVSNINSADAKINIHQESSEIVLNIHDFSFQFEATLEEGLLRLPKSFQDVETKMLETGKRMREIKASYGKDKAGTISFTGEKGVILLKDI